ncbi:MAG: NAD(P)/FAD-dependent oxidoreductase [Rhodothermales bacterium]
MSRHVVIIGNGITGVTAARFIRKLSDDRITMISDETDYFFARTALMYLYMGHMRYRDVKPYEDFFWKKNRIDLVRGYVEQIDTDARKLHLRDGSTLDYDVLLIATGSKSNKFGWPGQDLDGVQGLYGMPDLKQMEQWTQGVHRAVVVGGGLIGVEMAEMLHTRHIPVTFLVREKSYMDYLLPPEEAEMINEEIRAHHIDLRLATELREILPDENGRARAVVTSTGEEIACAFVGLTVGVHPNIEVVKRSKVETNRGVLVNAFFETNIPNVYAAGDCAEFRRDGIGSRRIEQLWYTGRKHGKTVARTICGHRIAYDRGVFFNSAKFFTLEYQTYGDIKPKPEAGVEILLWQDRAAKKLVRIQYAAADARVLGFNLLGIRYRHDVCERWILEGCPVDYVLKHLREANFDPEFYRRYERDVVRAFSRHQSV